MEGIAQNISLQASAHMEPAEIIDSLQFIGKHRVVQGEVEQGTDNESLTEAPPQLTSREVSCGGASVRLSLSVPCSTSPCTTRCFPMNCRLSIISAGSMCAEACRLIF